MSFARNAAEGDHDDEPTGARSYPVLPAPDAVSPGPEPTNLDRASWAHEALMVFAKRTGLAPDLEWDYEDSWDTLLSDFLADLLHWCAVRDLSLNSALAHAEVYWLDEVTEEEGTMVPEATLPVSPEGLRA